ncbi:MAG: polysaccharide export protein EpsE [Gammaproteobacteria bacterium]|nr:polysaccharide export protein EpsE [Gammaproteobacteria bacterium]
MKKFIVIVWLCLTMGIVNAAPEYVLGTGDIVRLSVYGQKDLDNVARINEIDKINFPLVGEIKIGGLTASQAEAAIAEALKKGGFVRSPQVTLIVEQYRSRQVSILGQVNKPGKYSIDGPSRLIDILALAGGLRNEAADYLRLVRQEGGKEQQQVIDVYGLLNEGQSQFNVEISNDDIIYVPLMDRFYIYGNVHRPGVYRLERDMTVMQGIAVGGGVTPKGTESGIILKRRVENGEVKNYAAEPTTRMKANDVIYVKESFF